MIMDEDERERNSTGNSMPENEGSNSPGNSQDYQVVAEDDEIFGWRALPSLILEDVFSDLQPKWRHVASMVCKSWYGTFYRPRLWRNFSMDDKTLTRKKTDMYHRGYVYELCPNRLQMCLARIGRFIKHIAVKPMFDYYSLFGFLNVLQTFLTYFDDYPMPYLETFAFTFACQSWGLSGSVVHGTGGKILQGLESLLKSLRDVEKISLNQLLLSTEDAPGLLESLLQNCTDSIVFLELLNCTKQKSPLYQVAFFPNLQTLVISPQNIDDDVLLLLAQTELNLLCITQDMHTNLELCVPVMSDTWKEVVTMAPRMNVKLLSTGKAKEEILVQPHAPVTSVVYETPYLTISNDSIMTICANYSYTLCTYGHTGLPKSHGSRSFDVRADASLYYLIRNCENIHTLAIRERVSTATLILIAKDAKKLKHLHVRRNAILKKIDWPKNPTWSDCFYEKLKDNSLSYDKMEDEISNYLGRPWSPLSDKLYQKINI